MRRFGRIALVALEIALLVALIIGTRCANAPQVFVGGEIYFVDADCYARMSRARICYEHPGTVVRRHDFENYPCGISPHTTAPFDYLIVALAAALSPLTKNALDLAGAFISPLLGLGGGIFLYWWLLKNQVRFRWAALLLYAASPILVHGTALGRPDHQSLLIVLTMIGICAEISLAQRLSRAWNIVAGAAWALAWWVSFYEPFVLLAIIVLFRFARRGAFRDRSQRAGAIVFVAILLLAVVVERRMPSWPHPPELRNWAGTIGELRHLPLTSALWWQWCSGLLLLAPLLFWKRRAPDFLVALFVITLALTIWQVRWGYFFVLSFCLLAPSLLEVFPRRFAAWLVFIVALFPVAQFWDRTWWPSEGEQQQRAHAMVAAQDFRDCAMEMRGDERVGFIAPWWESPALAYWSLQDGIAGSSHEGIQGIVESARFFIAMNPGEAGVFARKNRVRWVIAGDAQNVAANSAAILGKPPSADALCFLLDERPSFAPSFLKLLEQKAHAKVYRTKFPEENASFPSGSY